MVVVSALAMVSVGAAPAEAATVSLNSGQTLSSGQSLNNGTGCTLVVQATDGNVVEICGGAAKWSAVTQGNPGDRLTVGTDGNVVVYTSGGGALFRTGTQGYPGARLSLQDDQNIVVYSPSNAVLWAKNWIQSPAGAKSYSKVLFPRFGWSVASEFPCLDNLWQHESGWVWNADNPTSSAYGIPQSLPGSKMASFGPDWVTDGLTQVQWGLSYIKTNSHFSSPCTAWAYWQANGHY